MLRIAAAVLALSCAVPAYAGCVKPEKLTADLEAMNPGLSVREVPDVSRWLKAFNEQPPVSKAVADRILIYSHPKQPTFFAAFIINGCFVTFARIHPETMRKIETAAMGEAI